MKKKEMLIEFGIFFIVLFTSQISVCEGSGNARVCITKNKAVEVQVSADGRTCRVSKVPGQKVRDDYIHKPGVGYHKLHTNAKDWNEARKVCMAEGAHLAIVNSKAEEKVIVGVVRKEMKNIKGAKRDEEIWLGGHNIFGLNDWVTVLGDTLSSSGYVNWSKSCNQSIAEPNNLGGNERCLSQYYRCEGLNDYPCEYSLAFICEIPDICL